MKLALDEMTATAPSAAAPPVARLKARDAAKMRAAGVILVAPDGKALFLQRSADGDHEGEWSIPGGKIEENENSLQAVLRELAEETGLVLEDHEPEVIDRRVSPEGVDFITYLQYVDQDALPKLSDEHDNFAWSPLESAPEPLHPGLRKTLKKHLAGDENKSTATRGLLRSTIKYPPAETGGGERAVDVSFKRGGAKSKTLPMAPEARHLNQTTTDDATTEEQSRIHKLRETAERIKSWDPRRSEEIEQEIARISGDEESPLSTPVTLCIVRHGATKLNNDVDESEDRIRGWRDVPLVEKGRKEARKAAKKLQKEHVAAIYCSDLSRAVETAEIVGEELELEPIPTRKLRPWNLGDYTGMTTKEALPKIADFVRNKPTEDVPKGESFDDFVKRSFEGYYECAKKHPGKIVVLVSHHRNERSLESWDAAGQPLDHKVDLEVFLEKGDPPGGVKFIETTLEALRGDLPTEDEKKDDEDGEPEVEKKEDGGDLKVKVKVKVPLNEIKGDEALALDRASVREIDQDGHLGIEITNISKANICPYLGKEIPGWEDLSLDPDAIYQLFRDPGELEKAATSFNSRPVLNEHIPVFASDYQEQAQKHTVGTTGSDCVFEPPYLRCSMRIWEGEAIAKIQSGMQKEISCGYHYRPDMKAGTFQGTKYDGVMRDIVGNHVALVREGRAGADVVVGDSKESISMKKPMTRVAAFSIGLLVPYVRTKLAADQRLDLRPILCGLTAEDVRERGPAIATAIRKACRGKLAKDTSLGEVAEFLDMLKGGSESENEEADEAVEPAVQKSMENSAKIEPMKKPEPEGVEENDEGNELKNFLKGKLSEDDYAHACGMMGGAKDAEPGNKAGEAKLEELGAAHDLDPRGAEKGGTGGEPEQEREDEGKEWRRGKGATDEPPGTEGTPRTGGKTVGDRKYVTKDEMEKSMRAAAESARKIERDIREAERVVQPWVGNLQLTFDSSEQVYRKALKMIGVPGVDRIHESALRTILEMQPKPGARRGPAAAARVAEDSAVGVPSFAQMFPDASRIRLT